MMRDRLPYPDLPGASFAQWCEFHKVTPTERQQLFCYLLAVRFYRMLAG